MSNENKTWISTKSKIRTWCKGDIPILEIEPNERIETHVGGRAVVNKLLFKVHKTELLEIKANGKTLICTPDTLIYTSVGDIFCWVVADTLVVGDKVQMAGGEYPVESIQVLFYTCSQMLYTLDVPNIRSYIANDFLIMNY